MYSYLNIAWGPSDCLILWSKFIPGCITISGDPFDERTLGLFDCIGRPDIVAGYGDRIKCGDPPIGAKYLGGPIS